MLKTNRRYVNKAKNVEIVNSSSMIKPANVSLEIPGRLISKFVRLRLVDTLCTLLYCFSTSYFLSCYMKDCILRGYCVEET